MNQTGKRRSADLERELADYLRDHPGFFADHPELLSVLTVPHASGRATSLIERQLAVLREQNRDMDRRLHELVAVASENDRLAARMHRFAVSVVEATGLDRSIAAIRQSLQHDFETNVVVIKVGARPGAQDDPQARSSEFVGPDDPGLLLFDDFFKIGKPRCGRIQLAQSQYLFGDRGNEIESVALIPLKNPDWRGLLALGDREPDRFQPGMGTLFLSRMGELISAALERYLHVGR